MMKVMVPLMLGLVFCAAVLGGEKSVYDFTLRSIEIL